MTRHYHLLALAFATIIATGCSNERKDVAVAESSAVAVANKDMAVKKLPADAVPFSYRRHICFDVMLRDSFPARMIFDTGANSLLLDSAFYDSRFASNGNLRKAMLGGAGNGMEMANIDASGWNYKVGGKSHHEQMAVVMNLRKIVGDDVDGLFGLPFMQGERVEFNYADGYTFNGDFLLDTGMPGTLSLNSTTAGKLKASGVLDGSGKFVYTVGGIGGSAVQNDVCATEITVGRHALNDVRITWSGNSKGSLADDRYAGLIGNELLERFDVIIDFAHWVIYLRPNSKFSAPQPNYFGIAFTPMADHWIVNGLLEGGNAEKAGLRRGDRIEAINGIRVNDNNALYPLPDVLTLTVLRESGSLELVVEKEQ